MAKLIQELFSPTKKLNALRTISLRFLHTQAFSPRLWLREKTNIPKSLCSSPHGWKKYTWLVYSPSQMGGFCKYCVMHNNPSDPRAKKRPLVTAPFQKLEKATGKDGVLEHHQKMQCHQLALEAGIAIIRSVQKPCHTGFPRKTKR